MIVSDLYDLYSKGGVIEVIRGLIRFGYYQTPARSIRRNRILQTNEATLKCTVDGVSAKFHITNSTEFDRFDTIGGLDNLSEEKILRELLKTLSEDDIFFDIGANVGLYTCMVGKKLSMGQVHAFEPHPSNFERLRDNVTTNNISDRVVLHKYALSDKNGEFDLSVQKSSAPAQGAHSLVSESDIGETVKVTTYKADERVESDLPTPDVIKIDVEGAELRVLRGFEESLIKNTPKIFCEIHTDRLEEDGASEEELIEYLSDIGYDVTELYERSDKTKFIKAIASEVSGSD